jgi:sugar phosphate isomerase/epimerase
VAEALGTDLIRICIKKEADIPFVNKAVEQAAERGIRLAHQCHTTSLFEEVDSMLAVLEQIGHSNFGIIYEPANLMLCSQKYGQETLERLQPYLMNVYVQNHQELPEGPVELPTFCKGQVRFQHLELWEPGGVDYSEVFAGLKAISYDGFFTIHQARGIETTDDVRQYVDRCKSWFESQF